MLDVFEGVGSCCCTSRSFLRYLGRCLSRDKGRWYTTFPGSVDVACVACDWPCGVLFHGDMPVNTADLFGLFYPSHFLPPCWAGIAPCSMSTFAHCASRGEPFRSLLPAVFCLVLLCTIAAKLGCVTLSADVTVIVAAEALFHPAGAVIELALVYMAIP